MVAGYSAAQVRAAEAPHLAAGEPLMLRAAAALADAIAGELDRIGSPGGPVVALIGPGDNGGDALFAAATLARAEVAIVAVPAGERIHPAGSAAAAGAGVRILPADLDVRGAAALASEAALVVDGLLGTGTSRDPALRGRAREIVAAVDAAIAPARRIHGTPLVVAVDLPSGIHPDDGTVPDPTVLRADLTVTFGAVKAGLLLEPAADYAGRLELVDLGLGPELATMTPLVERA
ncbi:NAD(P)H-hydrate epimerase [Agromyces sp. MMS24-K17]|uniref:NAD(P)H-hydrate epimerase n=1 Tax=Agromyces sp. MMS24-K17 TaxID=3372850 RepID=UPI00375515C4